MSRLEQFNRLALDHFERLDIAWAADLNQEELLVILAINHFPRLTLKTLAEKTASTEGNVSATLAILVSRGILIRQEEQISYGINWARLKSLPRKLPQSATYEGES